MASETLKVSPEQMIAMKQYYEDFLVKPVQYSEFRAQYQGVTITGYTSGKVLFQGGDITAEVARWQGAAQVTSATPDKPTKQQATLLPPDFAQWTIIGSDEVGNGSYFGALTVCAVYLNQEMQSQVIALGVKDSKMLTDVQIVKIAKALKELVPYHLTVCNPTDYNRANLKRNANAIKVSLHNFTLLKLVAKLSRADQSALQGVLIDQFTSAKNYYQYLKQETTTYTTQLYFVEKGEQAHLAVACASIIARAAFLESLELLGKTYGLVLPSGAGAQVDQVAARLIKTHGEAILDELTKKHFKNTEKAIRLAKK